MKKIAVKDIQVGTIFSDPVYIEGNNLFVPAGVAIRKKDLAKIQSWGVETLETDGRPIDPSAVSSEKTAAAGKAAPEEETAGGNSGNTSSVTSLPEIQEDSPVYRSYMENIQHMDEICTSIANSVNVEPRAIDNIASRILQAVREQRDSYVSFILGGKIQNFAMAKSLVNTAILSTLIALELRLSNHKVLQITTGALIHDVGMLRIPKEIVEKRGGLSEAELQRIQSHALYAYKIVTKELLYPEDIGLIALQHHERWDGEGYPRRLSGATIDLGARIVSVADAFEAMVSHKPYRNSLMGYQAMKNLLSDNLRRFDPDVIKAFIQTMGIYPIGSIVLLNSGAMARVTNVQKTAPLRPEIKILIDEFGTVYKNDEGDDIDLFTEKSLYIARAVDPKEAASRHG